MGDNGLGTKIKEIRKKKKMSQQTLADLAGYTDRSTISRIEKGLVDLPESKIMSIAKALGVSPKFLVGWDGNDDELKVVARNQKAEPAEPWDKFDSLSEDKKKFVTDIINLYFDTEVEERKKKEKNKK